MTDEITLTLHGLHCNACVGRVKAALAPFAREVEVQLTPKQAAKLRGSTGTPAQWAAAVASAGAYTATVAAEAPASLAAGVTADSVHADLTANSTAASSPRTPANAQKIPTAQLADFSAALPIKSWRTYYPLTLLTAFLVLVPALAQWTAATFDWHAWMRHFMAAFFLSFAFFKLLDIRAFATAYAGYDLLAARWTAWGFIYPFVELALGVAYLINFNPPITNTVTLIVMGFSLAGVVRAVMSKRAIRCACLGAVFNLPMSTVTIVEDGLMAAMALWMLLR